MKNDEDSSDPIIKELMLKEESPIPSLSETFAKLRELMAGGFWDDCICVCRGLDKDNPCHLKCKEFFNESLTNSHKAKAALNNTKQ